jgi:hypothetical protein
VYRQVAVSLLLNMAAGYSHTEAQVIKHINDA